MMSNMTESVADLTADWSRPLIVLYAGDWDPSGLHMSEVDLPGRLVEYGAHVDLRRIALAVDDLPNLPSFHLETKAGDPRALWFRERSDDQCWELDAMSPVELRQRLRDAVEAEIDWPKWKRCTRAERAEQDSLALFVETMPLRTTRRRS